MKLIRAEFENFRLLRHLSINFSTDESKKLTVIRAENESGKTTILNAMQWALYGDNALPEKGRDYRLHPIDWGEADGRRVPITAMVEFEITSERRSSRGTIETRRQYRIIRSAFETVKGDTFERSPSSVELYHLGEKGSSQIDPPDAFIADELPSELREVFFTDGDKALSFIEAAVSVSTKRERVEKAIRSLLGLAVIEDAMKHVRKTASEVNKAAKKIGADARLTQIASDLERIEGEAADLNDRALDAKEQFVAFDEKLADVQKKLDAALVKGDREKLKSDLEQAKKQLEKIDNQRTAGAKEHSNLFRGLAVARELLEPTLRKALDHLEELKGRNEFPKASIPVLAERLVFGTCICGESLDDGSEDGQHRRDHIQHLIDDSQKADELQSTITDLYFASRTLQLDQTSEEVRWLAAYTKVVERRDELEIMRQDQGLKLKALDAQLDSVPDTDIQGLRETKRRYAEQRDRFHADETRYKTQLGALSKEQETLIRQRDNLLRELKKGARVLAELEVTQDVLRILEKSYDRVTNEELGKVSSLMNSIFLEMIGADPDQGAIIKRAEISKDFDIVVYGPHERTLNPDRDLNGASRRALTLAFILALTKVSEVEAPNVIDTPLGMMSGYVKRSVLKTTIRESSQVILFLTRSEISDCDEIIDAEAGRVITLTNPAHYPRMLLNNPNVDVRTVLRCECNHRQSCPICERRQDVEYQNEMNG
jgi:DNA sulfur modification protein DndD